MIHDHPLPQDSYFNHICTNPLCHSDIMDPRDSGRVCLEAGTKSYFCPHPASCSCNWGAADDEHLNKKCGVTVCQILFLLRCFNNQRERESKRKAEEKGKRIRFCFSFCCYRPENMAWSYTQLRKSASCCLYHGVAIHIPPISSQV